MGYSLDSLRYGSTECRQHMFCGKRKKKKKKKKKIKNKKIFFNYHERLITSLFISTTHESKEYNIPQREIYYEIIDWA